jgi:hypothetical protein
MRRVRVRWIVVALALTFTAAYTYRYAGRTPERVDACGRTFGHTEGSVGAGPFTLDDVKAHEPQVRLVRELSRGRELWASPGCGLGVFVRVGDDRFLGYGLLGGP